MTTSIEPAPSQALREGQPSLSRTSASPIQSQCQEAGPPCAISLMSRYSWWSQGPSALIVHMPVHKVLLSCLLCFIFKTTLYLQNSSCKLDGLSESQCVIQLQNVSRAGHASCLSLQAPAQPASQALTPPHFPSPGSATTAEMGNGCLLLLGSISSRQWVLTSASSRIAGDGVHQGGAERSRWDVRYKTLQDTLISNLCQRV